MISFDYARQLDNPFFVDETTEGFWEAKKARYFRLFGIVNEGSRTRKQEVSVFFAGGC